MNKLKLLLIPLLALTLFASAAKPALAWPWTNLWNTVQCAADINCTVRAASTSAGNFAVYNAVGKDFEDIEDGDLQAMLRGEWNDGLVSAVGKVGDMAYAAPPASAGYYLRTELADNLLNNAVQAQDATLGQAAISPIYKAWQAMRNIAYGFFALIMVAIGFMIIFQKQLPTRTVVTFTYALPRILLGLVLITFSYPIIGLIIDVGIIFGVQVILQVFADLILPAAAQAGGVIQSFSGMHIRIAGGWLEAVGNLGAQVGALAALFLSVIFLLTFLVVLGLTIIRLAIAYGYLLVYTVFSPLIFLLGTLPGNEGSITDFFKNIFARTLVFPVIFFLTLLAGFMATTAVSGTAESFLQEGVGDVITGSWTGAFGMIAAVVVLAAGIVAPGYINSALGIGGKKK